MHMSGKRKLHADAQMLLDHVESLPGVLMRVRMDAWAGGGSPRPKEVTGESMELAANAMRACLAVMRNLHVAVDFGLEAEVAGLRAFLNEYLTEHASPAILARIHPDSPLSGVVDAVDDAARAIDAVLGAAAELAGGKRAAR